MKLPLPVQDKVLPLTMALIEILEIYYTTFYTNRQQNMALREPVFVAKLLNIVLRCMYDS